MQLSPCGTIEKHASYCLETTSLNPDDTTAIHVSPILIMETLTIIGHKNEVIHAEEYGYCFHGSNSLKRWSWLVSPLKGSM